MKPRKAHFRGTFWSTARHPFLSPPPFCLPRHSETPQLVISILIACTPNINYSPIPCLFLQFLQVSHNFFCRPPVSTTPCLFCSGTHIVDGWKNIGTIAELEISCLCWCLVPSVCWYECSSFYFQRDPSHWYHWIQGVFFKVDDTGEGGGANG